MYKHMIYLCAAVWFSVQSGNSFAQNLARQPQCVSFNYDDLLAVRKSLQAGGNTYKPALKSLIALANKLLNKPAQKVTDGDLPPTGDAHDFYAIGKFAWRNPNTPNGMPYIRGDGKYNEEAFGDRYDLTRFQQTVANVNTLTLAWFYTQNEQYAAKAAELLQVWFIDPATRMNPNMNCASALPGVYNGMAAGIIFTVVLIEMTEHVQMLRLSKSWKSPSDEALKNWFTDYKLWLQNSDFGKQEAAAKNNHATWYAAQLVAYSLLSGHHDGVAEQYKLAQEKISSQIMPDGSLPQEMRRVEGFHYFIYGLKAFNVLANGLAQFGYDLWSYKTSDGKSIALPYQFIIPYINGQKPWTTGGVIDLKDIEAILLLTQAAAKYELPEGKKAIDQLRAKAKPENIRQLYIYPSN